MIDLRDDGTISLDFENGKEPVVIGRPKFGAYKRLRAEAQRLLLDTLAYSTELQAQETPKLEPGEINELSNERSEKNTIAWWELVLIGDPTFKALASVPPPATDEWPAWMIYGTNVARDILDHWRRTPLARGGTPIQAIDAEIEARFAEIEALVAAIMEQNSKK